MFAGAKESVRIIIRVFGQRDEEAAAGLDARRGNFFQSEIFRNTLPPRIRIIYGIPSPAVKEAMVSAGWIVPPLWSAILQNYSVDTAAWLW